MSALFAHLAYDNLIAQASWKLEVAMWLTFVSGSWFPSIFSQNILAHLFFFNITIK
jgi:hypothetical protein